MSEDQKKEFITGFGVLIGKDGNIFLEMEKDIFSVPVDRDSNLREVRRYMGEILSDINAQTAAEYVLLKLAANRPEDTPVQNDSKVEE